MKKLKEIWNKIFGRGRRNNLNPGQQNDRAPQAATDSDNKKQSEDGIENNPNLDNERDLLASFRQNPNFYDSTKTIATVDTRVTELMPASGVPPEFDMYGEKDKEVVTAVEDAKKTRDKGDTIKNALDIEKRKNPVKKLFNGKKRKRLKKELSELEKGGMNGELKTYGDKLNIAETKTKEKYPEIEPNVAFTQRNRDILATPPQVEQSEDVPQLIEATNPRAFNAEALARITEALPPKVESSKHKQESILESPKHRNKRGKKPSSERKGPKMY